MTQAQTVADLKDTGVTVAPEAVVNEILPFCAQGQVGRDLLSQADYTADMQRNIGHQPGIARAALANKQARQVSHMAAGLAQFLARRYAPGVVDDGDLDKVEAALVAALDAVINSPTNLATLLRAGLMQPDGVTTTVDEEGLLSALGGNLLLNNKEWLTESGDWEAPVSGWYDVLIIGGGEGGNTSATDFFYYAYGGGSGGYKHCMIYLSAGDVMPVTIGAGGIGRLQNTPGSMILGGATTFGAWTSDDAPRLPRGESANHTESTFYQVSSWGGGFGAGRGYGADNTNTAGIFHVLRNDASFYGGGGGAYVNKYGHQTVGNGMQGAVYLRWHDPAKAAGPLPEPALLSARRMVLRAAAALATVNLYDPETGQGSVWREEDAEEQLAKGLITQEAWLEICGAKAAEERAAWLASPETEAERFEMLRMACEAKLTATDKLTTADYPISEEDRAAVNAYRKAIRELNHQPGAPWDGGGELTPWPELPAVTKVQEA